MNKNLNQDLYDRFGLEIDHGRAISGFRIFLSNKAWELTYPMRHPTIYKDPHPEKLYEAGSMILNQICRELFLDASDYSWDNKYRAEEFVNKLFQDVNDSLENVLLNTQVFINVVYAQKEVKEELDKFVEEFKKYTEDFPIIGVKVKTYKTKPAQILPSTSPQFDKEILDTLGVLDTEKYMTVLEEFETGLKLFTKASTKPQFKDVVEDMLGACDEVVKITVGNKNKGFKHAFDKDTYESLGLNNDQKEIFKHIKNWMDKMKHGSTKEITRSEVEMIISMSASFIRFVAVHSKST